MTGTQCFKIDRADFREVMGLNGDQRGNTTWTVFAIVNHDCCGSMLDVSAVACDL